MTGARAISGPRPGPTTAGFLAVAAAALLAAWLLVPTAALARGWLVAFAFYSGLPIGSVVLLMIHRLTGGRWGEAIGPVLRAAATATPLAALAFVPLALALPAVYPWAADPGAAPASVARLYLYAPWFLLRAGIALLGWSVLGVVFGRGHGGALLAGLGLAFYGLTISLVAVDWFLSLAPHFVSSAFASMIAIEQILAALALAAVVSPTTLTGKTAGDMGGLMIATILGVVYLELMTFIVSWYSDLPEKAAWYVERGVAGWDLTIGVAVLLAAVSFSLLLRQKIRQSRTGLRVAGIIVLAGIATHVAWLILPAFQAQSAAVTAACLLGAGVGAAGLALWTRAKRGRAHAR